MGNLLTVGAREAPELAQVELAAGPVMLGVWEAEEELVQAEGLAPAEEVREVAARITVERVQTNVGKEQVVG